MSLVKDVVITESMEIKTTPEKLFNYLTNIEDDESFKRLNADNVGFQWLSGKPWTVGSIAFAEKYLHGKLHKFKFIVTEIVPNKHIEYRPVSKLMQRFFPKKEFIIETKDTTSLFISSATFRIGWIGKTFFKKSIDSGLADFRNYLKKEGKNLKAILESSNS